MLRKRRVSFIGDIAGLATAFCELLVRLRAFVDDAQLRRDECFISTLLKLLGQEFVIDISHLTALTSFDNPRKSLMRLSGKLP